MQLIHFQGLNCFHDCVISIANHMGIHYADAFATLWSETDFRYDPYRDAYLTKRLITNLGALGAKVECFDCFSRGDVEGKLALFGEGEYMTVGMDAFYVPWNQFYQAFHGPHYFVVRNAQDETLLCFDPTYGKSDQWIGREAVLEHTFDICRIREGAASPPPVDLVEEAREVVRTHPDARGALLTRVMRCAEEEARQIVLLAKYVDALICNRYLYRFFLQSLPFCGAARDIFMKDAFFSEWTAVKNGLYKASASGDKSRVIEPICDHLNRLFDSEIAVAERLIADARASDC